MFNALIDNMKIVNEGFVKFLKSSIKYNTPYKSKYITTNGICDFFFFF